MDLSHAADGYVGIAQDIRLVFAMLAGLPDVEPTGLLMPLMAHDLPRVRNRDAQVPLAAGIVHWMSRAARPIPRKSRAGQLRNIRRVLATRHCVLPMPREMRDGIWRVLFEQTLPPSARALVQAQPFVGTDLSVSRLLFRTGVLGALPPVTLDVPGFDFALFVNARPIRLPPGVQPLVRYHDAIPLTDADMVPQWQNGLMHQRMVRACDPRTWFVCDSPSSVQDLALADPSRAERTRVIPCALAPPNTGPEIAVSGIVAARRTFRALGAPPAPLPAIEDRPRYVLAVSTFEPRKNFASVIRAWERVTARHDPDLRLVFVAGQGWLEDEGLRLMAPHVAQGRIMHLQSLPPDELQALMRQAECFAFPSFAEGFGYPPLEALQVGAPVIVSDIPVFRWTFGDAALFVDPYDVEALAQAMTRLCVSPDRDALRADLASRRAAAADRFRPDVVAGQWQALLDDLSPRKRRS